MTTPALSRVVLLGLAGVAVAAYFPSDASAATPPSACADVNNAQSQAAGCAVTNQNDFANTYKQLSATYGTERDPSPTKQVFPAGNQNNAVHVPNYGIPALTSTPSAHGARLSTSIGQATAANVNNPSLVAAMSQKPITGKSKHFHGSKAIQLANLRKSAQNIWAAQETLAHLEASKVCNGKTGAQLVTCAKAHQRQGTTQPFLGNHPTCENFVYNRFYDIERWTDRVNACGEDAMCKATITLDGTDGIAGKVLSASDVDPAKRATLQRLLDLAAGNVHKLPDCSQPGLKGDDLTTCEMARSMPPTAHVRPTYYGSIAGGGVQTGGPGACFSTQCPPIDWYVMSKNPYYDTQTMFTPQLMAAFSKADQTKYQSVQRLVAELAKGQNAYSVGKGQKYGTEWEFQRHMLDVNKNSSARTFHDYAKRKRFLEQRAQAFALLFNPLAYPAPSFGIPSGVVDDQLTAAAGGHLLGALTTGNAYPSTDVDPPSANGAVPSYSYQFDTYRSLVSSIRSQPPNAVDRFAWNNGTSPPQIDPAYKYPRLLCQAPDKMQTGVSSNFVSLPIGSGGMLHPLPSTPIAGPASDGEMPTPNRNIYSDVGTAACNYINAVLDEWARKDMPQAFVAPNDKPAASGCFADDPACDWDPREFMQGMDDLVRKQIKNVEYRTQERDYKFCKEWAGAVAGQTAKTNDNTELNFLAIMEAKLQGAYNEISKVPALDRGPHSDQVPWAKGTWQQHYPDQAKQDSFATFGEDRSNAETWGNDLFGVGYSYDAGWEIPLEWQPADTKDHYQVCNLGAGAHGGFEAYAYAFGSDKFDILDADIAAGFNDYEDVPVPGAPNQSALDADMQRQYGAFDLNFSVAGDDLYDKDVAMPSTGVNVTPAQGSNSWTLFNIPFQITFVTVDVSVGIGYTYEIDASVLPQNQAFICNHGIVPKDTNGKVKGWPALKTQPNLSLGSTLDAQGELDGIVDASASLAGLVGIGVECDITLLGIGVPAHVRTSVGSNGLWVDSALNMNLRTLDGSLSVYAEALFFTIFDVTILQWDGFHATVPLFNTNTNASFGNLDVLGQFGLQNPARSLVGL